MRKPINLQLGWPSRSLFPTTALHAACSSTLLNPTVAGDALIYGPDAGHMPLRKSLALWLTKFYKPTAGPVSADGVFIGNGASFMLATILAKFTDPGYTRRVFMLEPTYFLACPIFEDGGFEGQLRGVPEDEEGLDICFLRQELEKARSGEEANGKDGQGFRMRRVKSKVKYPKLYRYVIYAVPTFSNPSGKVMSLRRRRELLSLAREFDALVVADDVYDMLRWPVDPGVEVKELLPPPPRIVDVDRGLPGQTEYGNAVSNGSFSKLVGPGIRVSWVEGTSAFVSALSTHGATRSGGSPGHLASVFMDQMLKSGSIDKHIAEVLVPTYRKRYAVMMDAIEKQLVPLGARVTTGQAYEHDVDSRHAPVLEAGGFFTYIALPDDLQPAEKVAKTALDLYGLKFAHGGMMVAAGDVNCLERAKLTFGRGARLSWAWHNEQEILEGIGRLAQVMHDMRNGSLRQKPENDNREGLDQR